MLHLFIRWYERKPDWTPDYDKEHHGTVVGNTPDECMAKLNQLRESHDLNRYTRMEIEYVF